jgi:hypothetical protein
MSVKTGMGFDMNFNANLYGIISVGPGGNVILPLLLEVRFSSKNRFQIIIEIFDILL